MKSHVLKKQSALLGIAATIISGQISIQGVSFVNGGFEDPTGAFNGWTESAKVSDGFSYAPFGYGYGYEGSHWAILGTTDTERGWIQQTVSGFTIGASYTLSFLQASGWTDSGETIVGIIGSQTISTTFITPPNPNDSSPGHGWWNNWLSETLTFIADAPSLTFHVQGGSPAAAYRTAVDSFNITANSVPDGGLTIGLLGTVLCGLIWCRRKVSV